MVVTPLANWMGTAPIALGRGVLSALLGGFAVRVLVETWRCRAASAALSVAAGLLTTSVAIHVGWIAVESDTQRAMLSAGLQMLGHVSLLAALMLYARYVILDVEGLLPVRVKKVKVKKVKAVKKPAKKIDADDTELPVDPPQKINKPHVPVKTDLDPVAPPAARGLFSGKAQPAAAKAAALAATKPSVVVDRDDDEDDDEAASERGLSRAERKKLRRQMRRQGADGD
jgi:hypothetical protein